MKKIIITSIIGLAVGICLTITYQSVKMVSAIQNTVASHEKALVEIVGFLNAQIKQASSTTPTVE